jgi:hypothetical protein
MDDDVQEFLSKISEDEFKRLGDLIMGNNKMESLQLSCQLVSRHFPHIPDLACQHYGSYIHDMLQQSVKHYFSNNSLIGGGQQYSYIINNFIDFGEGEHINDMYNITDEILEMKLSINSRYNILELDNQNNMNLYPNALFLGEVSYEDEVIGLTFDIDGEEREFQLDADSFSIMNPDNSNELNLGRIHGDDEDDSPDNDENSDDDEEKIIIPALRPDEEWVGLGLGNRPISDEDLSDEEDDDDEFDAHQNELRNNTWNSIDFPWQEHTTPREYYEIIEGHEYEDDTSSSEENETSSLTKEETDYINSLTDEEIVSEIDRLESENSKLSEANEFLRERNDSLRNIQEYNLNMQPDEEFRNMNQNISDIENAETDMDDDLEEDAETDMDDDLEEDAETDMDDDLEEDAETDMDDDLEPPDDSNNSENINYISFNN